MTTKSTTNPKTEAKKNGKIVRLNPDEKKLLADLESKIKYDVSGFFRMDEAFKEIKDKKLYRTIDKRTFDNYCQYEWGFGRNYVNKLITAVSVMKDLGTIVPKPANESHVRELAVLESADDRKTVWQNVIDTAPTGGITATHIREAVKDFRPGSNGKQKPGSPHPIRLAIDNFYTEFKNFLVKHQKSLNGDIDLEIVKEVLDKAAEDLKALIEKAVSPTIVPEPEVHPVVVQ